MFSEKTRQQLEDLHRTQFLGIDLDILFMIIFSYYIVISYQKNFLQVFVIILLISIIVHRIFRINTRINELIFGKI